MEPEPKDLTGAIRNPDKPAVCVMPQVMSILHRNNYRYAQNARRDLVTDVSVRNVSGENLSTFK